MNKTDIPVEEHVEIYRESELYLNSQGQPIEPNLKIESKNIENFPDEFTKSNKNNMTWRPQHTVAATCLSDEFHTRQQSVEAAVSDQPAPAEIQ